MRSRTIAFLVIAALVLLSTPLVYSFSSNPFGVKSGVLASSNYSENLSVYLAAGETFWKVSMSGGNVSLNQVSIPSSVSGYSVTLTHYNTWQPQYDIFTQYGFGQLGGQSEPYPDAAVLVVNTTSQSDAAQLATSLDQKFALAFQQTNSAPDSFTFVSPISFTTEIHVYFWNLIPSSAGGFASMITQSQLQSGDLAYYELSYSTSTSEYSIAFGGMTALGSNSFLLYTHLGLSQSAYNYSSVATSSSLDIYVLNGLINQSNVAYTNHLSNVSAAIELSPTGSNRTIPNVNASLDFSFPTILAYRQITPTLTPAQGSNVTVTIFVQNVSPSGGPTAQNVLVNDSWINSQSSSFKKTVGQISGEETLASTKSMTVAYGFTVLASGGTFSIPATPVTYSYIAGNTTVQGTALLNPETLVVAGQNTPQLEAIASLSSASFQAGAPYAMNVTITNKGSGAAFSLRSDGFTKSNLPVGSSWSYISNSTSSSLAQSNASISFGVTWQDANGVTRTATTNTVNAVLGLASPGTPGLSLYKNVGGVSNGQVNVTLIVHSTTPITLTGLTFQDPVPTGMTFAKSFNSSSLSSSNGLVSGSISSIPPQTNETFIYVLNVTNPSNNYVFMPGSVSTVWNNQTVVHYSTGYGLPLGVVATKVFTPSQGFQGSNVTISIGIANEGNLPVYQVALNSTHDSFLHVFNSSTNSAPALSTGQKLNATLNSNLTGSPGVYNSSTSAASFIFAGSNQTASSKAVTVTIFHLPEANLTYSAVKVEEGHNIEIIVNVTNPANATINNVVYTLSLPKGLSIVGGGSPSFTISSLGPNGTSTHTFTVITNQPFEYTFGDAKLIFSYQGHQTNGIAGSLSLSIADDINLRYGVPIVIGLIIVVGTLFYVRRLAKRQSK